MDLKFTQTGKFLIAAGSQREGAQDIFSPVLYISIVGAKGWATQYPMVGDYAKQDEAAAAALHYGIQIITRQIKTVKQPDYATAPSG